MFSACNPSKCTHIWSSGQPMLQRPGSSWGFSALLKGLTSVVKNSCRSRDSNPQPRVTSPFLHLKTLDIILLIVNISVADDAFYKYNVFIVVIWRLNSTWKNVLFQLFLLLRWLKGGKNKVKNGLLSVIYLLYNSKSISVLHISYRVHKHANNWYRL